MELNQQQLNNQIYTLGMIVGALNETLSMYSENMQREQCGNSMAYGDSAFNEVLERYGISHNQILTNLRNGL